uniref:Uncharacterized protein n=1 Tax=Lepeophtheirus salmonis TaxID=72036 RepID=A0A0K2TBB4_LEPSM
MYSIYFDILKHRYLENNTNVQVEKIKLELDCLISIRALQAVGRLQDRRTCRQQVRNVGEEEGNCQKGQTGRGGFTEKSSRQSPQIHESLCKRYRGFTPQWPESNQKSGWTEPCEGGEATFVH